MTDTQFMQNSLQRTNSDVRLPWHQSAVQVLSSLPDIFEAIQQYLDRLPASESNACRTAIEALAAQQANPDGTLTEVAARSALQGKSRDLITVGRALLTLGGIAAKDDLQRGLGLYETAHELFRNVNVSPRPSSLMSEAVRQGMSLLLRHGVRLAVDGDTDAAALRGQLHEYVRAAWGSIPPQTRLYIDEKLLDAFDGELAQRSGDKDFEQHFVRDNIEAVLALELPQRQEPVRDRWVDLGAHYAPTSVRTTRRPQKLSEILTESVRESLKTVLMGGNFQAIAEILNGVKDQLQENLILRMNPVLEYVRPDSVVLHESAQNRYFVAARDSLDKNNPKALTEFERLHLQRSSDGFAKEWYAYALTVFGDTTQVWETIALLDDALRIEAYAASEQSWTGRWNLACAKRRVSAQADEALGILVPVLKNATHPGGAFEHCMLWAIDQNREDILAFLLPLSRFFEAQLLATLQAIEAATPDTEPSEFLEHFQQLGQIIRDPDFVFDGPMDELTPRRIEDLVDEFSRRLMLKAADEWFRQRFFEGRQRGYFKNWECAAIVYERLGETDRAWSSRKAAWRCTKKNAKVPPLKKKDALVNILRWAMRNGVGEDAIGLLRESEVPSILSLPEITIWEERLRPSRRTDTTISIRSESKSGPGDERVPASEIPEPQDAEHVIQKLAGSFRGSWNAASLSERADDIRQLLAAIRMKHRSLADDVPNAIAEVLSSAHTLVAGVDEEHAQAIAVRMKERLPQLTSQVENLPFELHGLMSACQQVIQKTAAQVKTSADVTITPPSGLKCEFDLASTGEAYATHIFCRIGNRSHEVISDLAVRFSCPDLSVRFPDDVAFRIDTLAPGETRIVECPAEISVSSAQDIDVRIFISYQSAGIQRTKHDSGPIPVRSIGGQIPPTQTYVTSAPVTRERGDLFHGRDKELVKIPEAFAGGRLLKLYFVNGVRAVGKSTLMCQLAARVDKSVLPLILNLETALGQAAMTDEQLVRQLARQMTNEARALLESAEGIIDLPPLPGPEDFKLDPAWVVFDTFTERLLERMGRTTAFLAFDEMQRLVERIANPQDPMQDGFLTWLRNKVQGRSSTFIICTASEPYSAIRKRHEHTLWRNMEPYDISFVDRTAMERIATTPVARDGVRWLPEALDALWDMTEGHPWITQSLAERTIGILNDERRRIVAPQDIERTVTSAALDSRYVDLWWNEQNGLVTPNHRQIAFLILCGQPHPRHGIREADLVEACRKRGIPRKHIDEMRVLELITELKDENVVRLRIRGGFLERHVAMMMERERHESEGKGGVTTQRDLAMILDWENVKISLLNEIRGRPDQRRLEELLTGEKLANTLLHLAKRHGTPRQRWAVADWGRARFQDDLKPVRAAGIQVDVADSNKPNASDHVAREKIHQILREHDNIHIYIIGTGDGDFKQVIDTLAHEGKQVILWGTRNALHSAYGESMARLDSNIQIEWLEDFVLAENPIQT